MARLNTRDGSNLFTVYVCRICMDVCCGMKIMVGMLEKRALLFGTIEIAVATTVIGRAMERYRTCWQSQRQLVVAVSWHLLQTTLESVSVKGLPKCVRASIISPFLFEVIYLLQPAHKYTHTH